ncbi:MAG: hypothetical protein LCH38_12980 [Proteobacteria bacterium]|nr:hypothetical protein [Pseudomonadota bacterium]
MEGNKANGPASFDEAAIAARFIAMPEDVAGHIAYALHRRALFDFRAGIERHHGRGANADEETAFLVGETGEGRIAAYRAAANAMLEAPRKQASVAVAQGSPEPDQPRANRPRAARRLSWFGLWGAPILVDPDAGPINWRGLFLRLFILLLAVIFTALLLRILVVQA